jgi:hypothetical protein
MFLTRKQQRQNAKKKTRDSEIAAQFRGMLELVDERIREMDLMQKENKMTEDKLQAILKARSVIIDIQGQIDSIEKVLENGRADPNKRVLISFFNENRSGSVGVSDSDFAVMVANMRLVYLQKELQKANKLYKKL